VAVLAVRRPRAGPPAAARAADHEDRPDARSAARRRPLRLDGDEGLHGRLGRQVDRLTAVKEVLDDFLTRRRGDRVGLIFFGSAAFVEAPFTEDLDALRTLLDEAQVRMAGPKTALGDAIGLALTVFEHDPGVRERVLIALTDGNDTGSDVPPARAAEIARDRKITI